MAFSRGRGRRRECLERRGSLGASIPFCSTCVRGISLDAIRCDSLVYGEEAVGLQLHFDPYVPELATLA